MFRKALLLFGLALPVFIIQGARGAQDLPPAVQWVSSDAVLVVEATDPMALMEPLLHPEVAKTFDAFTAKQKPNFKLQQLQGVLTFLELQLGTDWRASLRQLVGGGGAFAVYPYGGMLLALDTKDEKMLQQLHEVVRHFATTEALKQNRPELVASREYCGATAWTVVTNEAHSLIGPRLLLANRPDCLDRALALRAGSNTLSVASTRLYKAAREAVGKDAVASLFLNMQVLRLAPGVKKALADDGNPMSTLLLADTKEALSHANWLALGVYVKEGKLAIKMFTDGQAPATSKAAAFATAHQPDEGLRPELAVPGGIASLSFYRDLHAFYAAKDELFPERTSGLIFFENMMGIFFSGIELTDGVFGETKPDIRLVVASQRYDPAIGTPETQVPGFAVVLHLRHPQTFGETMEEAWQKALGLVNFTRGQQALPGLVIDRAIYHDVKYSLSYYRPPGDKAKDKSAIDIRYNFRPSLARPGEYLILSSTDGLAQDLIDALKKESTSPAAQTSRAAHSLLSIDGAQLRAVLLANREPLIRKNMVDKGNSREQAEGEIGLLLTVVECFEQASFTLARDNGRPQATLEFKLKLPKTKSEKTAAMK